MIRQTPGQLSAGVNFPMQALKTNQKNVTFKEAFGS